jgi:hypothetical protein
VLVKAKKKSSTKNLPRQQYFVNFLKKLRILKSKKEREK